MLWDLVSTKALSGPGNIGNQDLARSANLRLAQPLKSQLSGTSPKRVSPTSS